MIKVITRDLRLAHSVTSQEIVLVLNAQQAKQHSKWRHEHPRYNKADFYYLLTRQCSGSGQATTASTITCIPNSTLAIQSSALAVLAIRQQNICCSTASSTSHSERESGQTTLLYRCYCVLTQSHYTDTRLTCPCTFPITSGPWLVACLLNVPATC